MAGIQTGSDVRYRLLDPLRGIAALWVFAFHYGFSASMRETAPWAVKLFGVGNLGVPMFFVISGYCMIASVRLAIRDDEPVAAFLQRRALRIYPPFWCSLVVVAALPFVMEAISALKTGSFVPPSSLGNANYGFLNYRVLDWLRVGTLTQVFAPLAASESQNLQSKFTSINAVYWTLAIEFQFYLVMAIAVGLRSRAVQWLGLVTVLSAPIAYTGLWRTVGVFLPYWPMFAVGILLYFMLERGISCPRLFGRSHRIVAGSAIVALAGWFAASVLAGYSAGELPFAVGFALALWLLHAFDGDYVRGLTTGDRAAWIGLATLRYLGLMSYSLYLLHGRLQFLAQQVARQILPQGIAFDLTAIALTCGICFVFYYSCERPFIRSRQPVQRPSRPAEELVAIAG
jgi:peptidoglycan/LPS O-acetylase OafA/YrhL